MERTDAVQVMCDILAALIAMLAARRVITPAEVLTLAAMAERKGGRPL